MLEPFHYEFFVRGLIGSVLVGVLCGMMGVYIVLRRMAYIGHGLSHAVFGGAVVSYVLSFNFYLGASLWGFLAALLINATTKSRKIGADAAIGIITTASFAVGIAIVSRYKSFTRNFDAALFGNILAITDADLIAITLVTAVTILTIFLAYKHLLFVTFDPEVAGFYGVPVGWIDALFSLILAATIVVSMQIIGVTLIAAAIVTPPIVARLLSDSFNRVMLLSPAIGALCGLVGMYLSFYIDVSSGATIVLVASTLFVLVISYNYIRDRQATERGRSQGRRARSQGAPELFD
ncbi:MAG: metal ABC transporter permease [Dehalococcoidia bacterium]|nr:metal ABC transporter permease [Dehalococcoidia bacterium]